MTAEVKNVLVIATVLGIPLVMSKILSPLAMAGVVLGLIAGIIFLVLMGDR
jgi:hypothetical protein